MGGNGNKTSTTFVKAGEKLWKGFQIPKHISPVLYNLEQVNGFYLKYSHLLVNKPNNFQHESQLVLEITPTIRKGTVSVSIPRWKSSEIMIPSPFGGGPSHHFLDGNQEEIFSLQERSTLSSRFGGRYQKEVGIVDVYIANKAEPVGWIKHKSGTMTANQETIIMEYGSDVIFILEYFYLNDMKAIKISKQDGTTVATMQPKKGKRDRETRGIRWTDWKIYFATSVLENVANPVKIIILTAFILAIKDT